MNIQRAAEASGLTPDTIRFYERTGVLPRPPRRSNGYRDYSEDHVLTLKLARGLRDSDLLLPAIRDILTVAHDGSCGELRSALLDTVHAAIAEMDVRILTLHQTRNHLAAIEVGLLCMADGPSRIRSAAPCECVQLVVDSPNA